MLVYGDSQERVVTSEFLSNILRAAERLRSARPGLDWPRACVELFIDLSALLQGVADEERDASGHDEITLPQRRLMDALLSIAGSIDRSWRSGFQRQCLDEAWLRPLETLLLPGEATVKRCEGYAFYALYPESYLEAARGLPPDSTVIGLRSIGTGLAALVAASCGATEAFTLRPCGHPFD